MSKILRIQIPIFLLTLSQSVKIDHSYRSYQTTIYCDPSDPIQYPTDVSEVQEIIRRALREHKTVKAFGSRHSITDVICTDGIPMSLRHFDYKTYNENDKTATFGAGTELQSALEYLEQNNRTLIHVPTFGGITIAGATATGAHGSSLLHTPSLSDQMVSLTIIDGLGNIRMINSSDDLNAFRVHLGLLGIILEVTLQTVPLFRITVTNTLKPESVLFDGTALKWAHQHDWFQMWWFPSLNDVIVLQGNHTNATEGNAHSNLIPDIDPLLIKTSSVAFEALQATRNMQGQHLSEAFTKLSLFSQVVGKPPIFSEDVGLQGMTIPVLKNPATGYGWRLESNLCSNKCAWDNGKEILPEESSMALDISQFHGVMQMIKDVLRKYPAAFYMIGIFIRFAKASDSLMGISSGRQSFSVEWATPMRWERYKDPRDGIGAYQAILQEIVTNYGGRPHWGKNGLYFFTQKILQKSLNPQNRQLFINAMHEFDPKGVFLNKFGTRILGWGDEMDIDPKVRHCALQDYCVCQRDYDCGESHTCSKLNHFNVCYIK